MAGVACSRFAGSLASNRLTGISPSLLVMRLIVPVPKPCHVIPESEQLIRLAGFRVAIAEDHVELSFMPLCLRARSLWGVGSAPGPIKSHRRKDRISIKDYRRGKNLKIQLVQTPFSSIRQSQAHP